MFDQGVTMTSVQDLSRRDWLVIGAGAVFIVGSFLPLVTAAFAAAGLVGVDTTTTESVNAWHSYATVGVLAVLATLGVRAAPRFTAVRLPDVPVGWDRLTRLAAAAGTVLVAVRGLTWTGSGVSLGYGSFCVLAAGAVLAVVLGGQGGHGVVTSAPAGTARGPAVAETPAAAQETRAIGVPQNAGPGQEPGGAEDALAVSLRRLTDLQAAQLVSDEEYAERRQRLLESL